MDTRLRVVWSTLLIAAFVMGFTVSGSAVEPSKSKDPFPILIKEKKVRPIAGKINDLPKAPKLGDYFSARSASCDSIMVQYGIQSEPKEGIELRLLQNTDEIQRIKVKGRCGRVVFRGLFPSTEYRVNASWTHLANTENENAPVYSVSSKSVVCRTSDLPIGKCLLKFAAVSDTHVSIITRPGGRMHCKSAEILKDVCADANRRACSAMIIAGDLTDANLPEEYKRAKESLSEYRGSLLIAPGNHDDRTPETEIWRSHFGSDAGLKMIDGFQFLWLNTANGKLNKPANLAAIDQLNPDRPAVIFSHMQLVPDDYLNDKGKVIRDGKEVREQLEKIGRSRSIIYIGHKNVATTAKLGQVLQMNLPQTTQFPAGWLEAEICPEGIYHRFIPSCSAELEELSRLLNGGMMKGIGYRDRFSFEIWNRFVPWPKTGLKNDAAVPVKKRDSKKMEKSSSLNP
ncbi:MAG: metallophosphoesterase [Planctomycetia bacterium]|nr:metallophosphoesterase [Planctomycetia bacterium]